MAFISSPIQYPATSSPREQESPRKRRRIDKDDQREPLATIENGRAAVGKRTIGGFVDGDDSEDEEHDVHRTSYEELSKKETQYPSINDIERDISLPTKRKDMLDTRQDSGYETASSPPPYPQTLSLPPPPPRSLSNPQATARTSTNHTIPLKPRRKNPTTHYSSIVACRSTHAPGKAQKSYYGIDIHNLLAESNTRLRAAEAAATEPAGAGDAVLPSVEDVAQGGSKKTLLWTEKYRAKKFTDLLGDERTHRSVLKWLKGWDGIVFHTAPAQPKNTKGPGSFGQKAQEEERPHRKILLLTGPPGLGKTTLAHMCARQAGYETHEINASDERSKDVVKNRIRDMVGTENVRGGSAGKKSAKPVCVVVDEVDGVVSSGGGGGAGEGGFVRALIDLLMLDQRNSNRPSYVQGAGKKKGDQFRLLRPIVLVCNDLYAPALRLLRQGNIAEIVHVRKPTLQVVVPRLHKIFEREGVPADSDAVRTLCESAWGVTSRRQGGKGGGGHSEGDVRALLVAGEWVAGKLREANIQGGMEQVRLTRRWIEKNVLAELAHGGGMAKNLGRVDVRDIVERVFKYNGGFSSTSMATTGQKASKDDIYGKHAAIGVAEASKRNAMDRLREMVEASGDEEKVMLDCFTTYPTKPYQDTTHLSKPSLASDWTFFHSTLTTRVRQQQEWDLAPYLSYPILAFHNLFSSSSNMLHTHNKDSSASEETDKPIHPLHTPRADHHASETLKINREHLNHLQTQLSTPLQRSFRSQEALVTELIPYTLRILNPTVKPVLINGTSSIRQQSEKEKVNRSVECMRAVGVSFEKGRVDLRSEEEIAATRFAPSAVQENGGWVYRMTPPLDELGTYDTYEADAKFEGDAGRARYALRQVLATTHELEVKRVEAEARVRRSGGFVPTVAAGDAYAAYNTKDTGREDGAGKAKKIKKDFFGREIVATDKEGNAVANVPQDRKGMGRDGKPRVWVSFKEGFSNAVRKPISFRELMEGC